MIEPVIWQATSAGPGWVEYHDQYHDVYECRLIAARMWQTTPVVPNTKTLKRYCHMEPYGPNYRVVSYPEGGTETQITGWKVYP